MTIPRLLRMLGFYWRSECNFHRQQPGPLCDYCRRGRYGHPLADLRTPPGPTT